MAIWRREVKPEPASPVGEVEKKTEPVKKEDLQKGEALSQRDYRPQKARKVADGSNDPSFREDYEWKDDFWMQNVQEDFPGEKQVSLTTADEPEKENPRAEDTQKAPALEEAAPAEPKESLAREVITPEEYARFAELASERKKHRKKEVVAIRISPETLALARATGKGYTGFLSRLLDEAIRDPEMVKRCL